jgi:hypothetical protein
VEGSTIESSDLTKNVQGPTVAITDFANQPLTHTTRAPRQGRVSLWRCPCRPEVGWEFACKLLMRHARFSPQLGEKLREFKVALRTLTPLI